MTTPSRISEAEWRVMRPIWDRPGVSAQEIIDTLSSHEDWSAATVKTMLNRLIGKKILHYEKSGKSYRYFPRITEEACQRTEADNFLHRVFNGALLPMLAHFVENEKLSPRELEELAKLLHSKRKR